METRGSRNVETTLLQTAGGPVGAVPVIVDAPLLTGQADPLSWGRGGLPAAPSSSRLPFRLQLLFLSNFLPSFLPLSVAPSFASSAALFSEVVSAFLGNWKPHLTILVSQ